MIKHKSLETQENQNQLLTLIYNKMTEKQTQKTF